MDTLIASPPRPSVALVVPNYNHGRYLPESLGSIAAQTRAPDRVVIIDDASTDDSLAVISRFIANHPGFATFGEQKNTGQVLERGDFVGVDETRVQRRRAPACFLVH